MRFLVVDDSSTMRRLIVRSLRQEGFDTGEVREAGDGFEALGMVMSQAPDFVICDITMPKLDGLKFVAALRTRIGSDRCKVLVLTSRASGETEQIAIRAGADGLIAKPFDPMELGDKVRTIMGTVA